MQMAIYFSDEKWSLNPSSRYLNMIFKCDVISYYMGLYATAWQKNLKPLILILSLSLQYSQKIQLISPKLIFQVEIGKKQQSLQVWAVKYKCLKAGIDNKTSSCSLKNNFVLLKSSQGKSGLLRQKLFAHVLCLFKIISFSV